jgi:hypothetical protein
MTIGGVCLKPQELAMPHQLKTEQSLLVQINMASQLAETAFKHALAWPNTTTLAAVDRTIGLLTAFSADAQRLQENGQAASLQLLTGILVDLTAARKTLGTTLGQMAADTLTQTKTAAAERAKENENRNKQHDADVAAFEARQKEFRKLV